MVTKKRIYIASKFRFISFITILMIILVIGVSSLFGINISRGGIKSNYEEVIISSGDTLWNIAKEYASKDSDIREVVFKMQELNSITSSDIVPGTTIKIPTNI